MEQDLFSFIETEKLKSTTGPCPKADEFNLQSATLFI
jgi:hypothetical protein